MTQIEQGAVNILDAYRRITGTDYTPTLTEYIELRRRAGEETMYGGRPAGTVSVKSGDAEQRATVPQVSVVSSGIPAVSRNDVAEETDGYTLLRGLKDPWN